MAYKHPLERGDNLIKEATTSFPLTTMPPYRIKYKIKLSSSCIRENENYIDSQILMPLLCQNLDFLLEP